MSEEKQMELRGNPLIQQYVELYLGHGLTRNHYS